MSLKLKFLHEMPSSKHWAIECLYSQELEIWKNIPYIRLEWNTDLSWNWFFLCQENYLVVNYGICLFKWWVIRSIVLSSELMLYMHLFYKFASHFNWSTTQMMCTFRNSFNMLYVQILTQYEIQYEKSFKSSYNYSSNILMLLFLLKISELFVFF